MLNTDSTSPNCLMLEYFEVSDQDCVNPGDVGIFLGVVDAFPNGTAPDLTKALSLDLDALPAFVAPDIGEEKPEDAELLYVEGVPVTPEIEA